MTNPFDVFFDRARRSVHALYLIALFIFLGLCLTFFIFKTGEMIEVDCKQTCAEEGKDFIFNSPATDGGLRGNSRGSHCVCVNEKNG